MSPGGVADDLAWWREHGEAPDQVTLTETLARLRTWRAAHDEARAAQPGPFLKLAWDVVFADEHGAVTAAIEQMDAALSRQVGQRGDSWPRPT